MEQVYVLTLVATRVVDRTCARIITHKLDSTNRVGFKMEAVLFFIDRSKKDATRPV